MKKTLVVYYSWSGNTRTVAKMIQEILGCDLVELEPEKPYPNSYDVTVKQAKKEIKSGYKPPLKTKIDHIELYAMVFVGSPNWWGTVAPPVASFLAQYNLSGKIVVPFCTHDGGGKQRVIEAIRSMCPNSKILKEFVTREGSRDLKEKISRWLKEIEKQIQG